jgi:hypothetical protein
LKLGEILFRADKTIGKRIGFEPFGSKKSPIQIVGLAKRLIAPSLFGE